MSPIETNCNRNKEEFMRRYRVKPSKKSANIESLLGQPVVERVPIFLDHRSLFEKDGQPFCLTAELYSAHWPSVEGFRELNEWCKRYGLKYEEPSLIESWYTPGRCRILMIYKDPHLNRFYS
jgi:hypothetical protein